MIYHQRVQEVTICIHIYFLGANVCGCMYIQLMEASTTIGTCACVSPCVNKHQCACMCVSVCKQFRDTYQVVIYSPWALVSWQTQTQTHTHTIYPCPDISRTQRYTNTHFASECQRISRCSTGKHSVHNLCARLRYGGAVPLYERTCAL